MKKAFLQRWLPMWAKQTVLRDNRELSRKLLQLQQENQTLRAYIKGLHRGLRGKVWENPCHSERAQRVEESVIQGARIPRVRSE